MSQCEAELNSTLKGAIEGLNIQRLANAFNDWPSLELRTDASAARRVIMRQGVGKVRHLHVKQLWIQDAVANGELTIVKIPRAENCSDALTHAWTSADQRFWSEMGLRYICVGPLQSRSSSSSSTQGPALYLLHLEAAAAGPRDRTPCASSLSTITTTQGVQWPAMERGGSRAPEVGALGKTYPGAGPPALDAGSPRAK